MAHNISPAMLLRIPYLCVVFLLVLQVASKSYSAVYERIWLWEAYNLAWLLDGAAQTAILPQLDPKKNGKHINTINNGNRGSL